MAWYYIAGELPLATARAYAQSLMHDQGVQYDGIDLQIMLRGGVDLVVPRKQRPTLPAGLRVRRITMVEACWHMLDRIKRVALRLSHYQQQTSRLGWWYRVTNLYGAYLRASQYRGISYQQWLHLNRLSATDLLQAGQFAKHQPDLPEIDVCVFGDMASAAYQRTVQALQQQLYPRFHLCTSVAHGRSDWLLCLEAGDVLPAHALLWWADEARKQPQAAMIYADDDCWHDGQRGEPRFKPDWSLLTYCHHDFIGHAALLNARRIRQLGLSCHDVDMLRSVMLALSQQPDASVIHIPAILLHCAHPPAVHSAPVAMHHAPATLPLVSIIMPTRDATDYVKRCLDSVLQRSTYPRFEILVVDNDSTDPALHAYLQTLCAQHRNVSVLRDTRPFNYSALNNHAVQHAQGDVLCFLNNDIQVISPDWLEQMLQVLQLPAVGVVGAKLYYADDTIQHAGVAVGAGGCANHLHAFLQRHEDGYCQRATHTQELSAVTAACMLTTKSLFLALGGFNEQHLPIAFNDVDYCLRVRAHGHKVAWTPHAELYHYESVSRRHIRSPARKKQAEQEVAFMRKTWQSYMHADPFYNPNFSYLRPDFVLGPVPNVQYPWSAHLKPQG